MENGRMPYIGEKTFDNYILNDRRPLFNNLEDYSLKGIITETPVSSYYFSYENRDTIQQTIRFQVYKEMNEIIDKQAELEIFIIMRSIYLQHSGLSYNNKKEFFDIIRNLNNKVIKYAVHNIITNLKQYNMYLDDLSTLPTPLEHPEYENNTRNISYDMSNYIGDFY